MLNKEKFRMFEVSIPTQSELQALIYGCLILGYASIECTKLYLLRQRLHYCIPTHMLRFNINVVLVCNPLPLSSEQK